MARNKQYTKEPTMRKSKIKTPAYGPEKSVTADLHTPSGTVVPHDRSQDPSRRF